MKIIISHDVDHLYPSDHFKDLIFPKLWIRSFGKLLKGEISFKIFLCRLMSIFSKRLNRIPEIVAFNKINNIPTTFFFGMANGLGMSYRPEKAKKWIRFVLENGVDAGVHGIDFKCLQNIHNEFNLFKQLSGLTEFGMRTHYVRYDSDTFMKFADIGYLYDCSEFNKKEMELKNIHKVGNMWEFPLHIMDDYILKNGRLDAAISTTEEIVNKAEREGIKYFSFLFHDFYYNDKTYPQNKAYYEWFVDFCKQNNFGFISYKQAVEELKIK